MTKSSCPKSVRPASLALALLVLLLPPFPAHSEDDPWPSLRAEIFGDRTVLEDDGAVQIYIPANADDAAIVPLSVRFPPAVANELKSLTLVIDRNPAPVAATFRFGDGFDADTQIGERAIATRIRIDSFSKVRAIAETADGKLHMASKFVTGAGGCSSPASKDAEAALANLGKIQVKAMSGPQHHASWREGVVMVRHPNFTGMQRDPGSGGYTPARFINDLKVTRGGKLVFRMEGGISISEDPNIRFNYATTGEEPLEVTATDTQGTTFAGRSVPDGS